MKQYTLFLWVIASTALYGMEIPQDYSAFQDDQFANGQTRYCTMLANGEGRKILLTARTAEWAALNSAHEEFKMGLQRVKPSFAFGRKNGISMQKKDQFVSLIALRSAERLEEPKSEIIQLVEAIADTEYLLINNANHIGYLYREYYELSRRDDIILLKKIIEHDNLPVMQHMMHEISQRLEQTDQSWPPASSVEQLNALSAYKIVKQALAYREKNQVDELPGEQLLCINMKD